MISLVDGLLAFAHSIKSSHKPTIFSSNQLIHLYSKQGLIREARRLFDEMSDRNVFTWNAIVSAYVKTQNLNEAKLLFDAAPYRDSVTYNTMLSGFVSCDGYESQALDLFIRMKDVDEKTRFNEFTLTTMLNLTAKLSCLSLGEQLHTFMVKSGNDLSSFAVSALVDMYSKCGCFQEACEVFNGRGGGILDSVSKNAIVAACCREGKLNMAWNIFWRLPELNDAVSWNTLISGYAQNGCEEETLELFGRMVSSGVNLSAHTFAGVLSACSGLKSLKRGKELHAWILKDGMIFNPFLSCGIVDVYCKCGNLKYAEAVHAATGTENTFSIASLIVGYSIQGNMVEARRLFDSLAAKNAVVWTAMFSGYVKSQHCEDVFELFSMFQKEEATAPDAAILVSLLGACALQATMDPGKQIHAYILRKGLDLDEKKISAMVDMYSKCGNITYARRIFERLDCRDSVLYNIMIAGFAHHGCNFEAFELFKEMIRSEVSPTAVTFVAVISACRHCGLVEEGEKYFASMINKYNMIPEVDHYACMIDLYGRANQLEKALELIRRIPIEPDAVILGTFINACRMHGNVKLAREVEERLLRFERCNGARYVQLANVYASEGLWDEMGRIRMKMRGKEVKKVAGCSWLHVESRVHIFTSGDSSHSDAEDIYAILNLLTAELNDESQIERPEWTRRDMYDSQYTNEFKELDLLHVTKSKSTGV